MPQIPPLVRRLRCAFLSALLIPLGATAPASAMPLEDYADYQPAERCAPAPKPGTRTLAR